MKYEMKYELTPWDNEPNEDPDTTPDDGQRIENPETDEGDKGKTFTQEDVERIVTKRNKAVKQQLAEAEGAYQALLKQTNLTKEQRDDFEAKLENIQKSMRSKEEQLKHEKQKAEEKFTSELQTAKEQAEKYQTLFEQSTIERAIVDAAMQEDGFSGEQFVSFLGPKAKIVEEVTQDGQPTGRLVPRIDWQIKNDEGETEVVRMAPGEVVKLMREDVSNFGNMFKSNVSRGIGEGTNPANHGGGGKVDPRKLSTADYMKLASTKEGRLALGLEKE